MHAYRQVAMGVGCHFPCIGMFGLGVHVADRGTVEMEATVVESAAGKTRPIAGSGEIVVACAREHPQVQSWDLPAPRLFTFPATLTETLAHRQEFVVVLSPFGAFGHLVSCDVLRRKFEQLLIPNPETIQRRLAWPLH